ncbi:hypothetical protein RUM44_008317 [Polyplax serrata]|uniref:Putative rRNA methyltransferase n=1 Tax=Polyplax serrata TaxID=468196 RepID=A0ABR1B808_POLSC
MGQKTKIGKQRKDRFYRLAKETGFRSRAAFKLLQLNRKFGFLEKSRVLVDLCAAPGGWMQVAKQNMPVSSLIVGVDLFPIKPVPGCISLVEDITTNKCKVALTKALQTWKADVVLNDGAPNVGTNWLYDAYQQSCLTLSAVKLASEFLREGGWFITKIFRSKDYNSLIWVLKQLFKKVQATKPQASRSESAEIFVVCQYYKAPDKVDPKFFQPQYVFKELEPEPKNTLNVFHPKKQRRAKAEGYKEGDYTLFNAVKVTDFLKCDVPIEVLQRASAIEFDDVAILNHPKTTEEIKHCFKDVKVLNRKDVKAILAWWKTLKGEMQAEEKASQIAEKGSPQPVKELTASDEEEIELDEIDQHIAQVKKEELQEQKKKRRTADKERKKLQEKLNLKMVLDKHDDPGLEDDAHIFRLSLIRSNNQLNQVLEQKPDILAESESEEELPQPKKVKYNKEETVLDNSGKFYREEGNESESEEEESSIGSNEGLGLQSDESDDDEPKTNGVTTKQKNNNPLLTDLDNRAKHEKRLSKVALWFEKENLKNLETEADEDYDLDTLSQNLIKKGMKVIGSNKGNNIPRKSVENGKGTNKEGDIEYEESDSDSESSDSDSGEHRGKKGKTQKRREAAANGVQEEQQKDEKKKRKKLDEEGLALGSLMISSKKKKRDLIDGAWNRYAFNDENLPDWFVQDEKENMTQPVPVPEEMVNAYKNKLKEVNVRSIKKVVEAKARKKRRMLKSLEKAKKKMEGIMDNVDISEREKVRNIQKLYKKAKSQQKKQVTYVVARKVNTAKRFKRPKGIKGPYRVVDPRMKKDMRRMKNKAKEAKKKKPRKK